MALIVTLAALLWSLVTTPVYAASSRLFVSTTSGSVNASDLYSGGQYAAQRVDSYTRLLEGEEVATRTIAEMGLDMNPEELRSRISTSSTPGTVLIDLTVEDTSASMARDLANGVATTFAKIVEEIERPSDGSPAPARVSVVDQAALPDSPVTPNTPRNLGLGVLIGVILGLAVAVVQHRLDRSVKERQTVADESKAPVLGTIPAWRANRPESAPNFAATEFNAPAEAFRLLRTNLQFVSVDKPPTSILVTSPEVGDGKTTVAHSLATALAQSGNTVVLVEGNLRNPTLAADLRLDDYPGLTDVLSGAATLDEALSESVDNFAVLIAGSIPPNPAELLASDSATALMEELQQRYDLVIVDSTPILPVADAAVLSRIVDGVLLVARYRHTKKEALERAASSIRAVGANILGCVLNSAPAEGKDVTKRSTQQTSKLKDRGPRHGRADESTAVARDLASKRSTTAQQVL